jgi:hypothetical protein
VNVCAYCGKSGHWPRDCHKKRADQQQQVRQVGELNDAKRETSVYNARVLDQVLRQCVCCQLSLATAALVTLKI